MTASVEKAMLFLYAQEGMTGNAVEKAVYDEALDWLVDHSDSQQPAAYLIRNALSNARAKVARRTKRNSPLELPELPSEAHHAYEALEWRDLLDQLPFTPRQKLVLLRCARGYSVREIARECGTSERAIYALRRRARALILSQPDDIA